MAKAHVLDATGANSRIAFHIAVPAGNNASGIAWTVAVKNSGIGGTTILPDGDGTGGTISSSEKTDITNGVTYEFVRNDVPIPGGLNLAGANAFLDALHAAAVSEIQPQLQAKLNYFGFTRT